MLSVYLYPVFSIIQIKHSFLYWAHLCNGEEVVLLMINCVDNESDGECNCTSILGREEIGQKASTAQSYKDVGALKTPRFCVFHILQQDS